MKKQNTVSAYAWECNFGLCRWAESTAQGLRNNYPGGASGYKPSPEAKPVRVKIMTLAEYKRLMLKVGRGF